jgi:phospholipid-binding lipoprotein MlaA
VLVTLEEPTVFVNFLLQHRIGKAAETLGRTVINLTLGLGGLIDVASRKPFKLPHRVNGFGYTMGFYGVKSGPYLFLPLFGSTSVRDLTGRLLDLAILPRTFGKPFKGTYWTLGYGASRSIDDRVELDLVLTDIRDNSPDPYISMKKRYLDLRQAEIDALHGKVPLNKVQPKKPAVEPPAAFFPAPPLDIPEVFIPSYTSMRAAAVSGPVGNAIFLISLPRRSRILSAFAPTAFTMRLSQACSAVRRRMIGPLKRYSPWLRSGEALAAA